MSGDDDTKDIHTRPPLSTLPFLLGFCVFDCHASCVLYTTDWGGERAWMENFCFVRHFSESLFFLSLFRLSFLLPQFFFLIS